MTTDNTQDDRPLDSGGDRPTDSNPDRPPRVLLRRADQLGIAVLTLFALVTIGGYWLHQAVLHHRVIDLDQAPPLDPGFRTDINSADWPELAQLPEIGETLARQIVAWRNAHGPFKAPSDLRRIKGIGPKKFDAMRPFVRVVGHERTAGSQSSSNPAADRGAGDGAD